MWIFHLLINIMWLWSQLNTHILRHSLTNAVLDLFVLKCLCDDFPQIAAHKTSVLSTESETEKRFPKPELEISFTPLKPNRLNIRRPGDDKSVTVNIKSTARKRKSVEIEVCISVFFLINFLSCRQYLPLIVYCCTLVLTCIGVSDFLFTRT